jgi:drug/metabolite transporter (DMT)-like permease
MLLSSLSFAFVNLIVKIISNPAQLDLAIQDYPPYEIVFFRSIISLSICFVIIKRKKIPFFGVNKKWLIIRGFFGFTALTIFFYTIKNIPIAIATIVQYLSPIFTIIFAIFLLKQKVKPIQWIFFAIAMFGVFLIGVGKTSKESLNFDPFWILMGVISAILSGVAYNAIMKCKDTDEPITVVMYFPLVAAPITLGVMLFNKHVIPQGVEWLLLLLIGIFTQIAQIFMTKSFHYADAVVVTPIKYLGAIYAVSIGFFIFGEALSFKVSLGIVIILTGVLLNSLYKLRLNRIKQN